MKVYKLKYKLDKLKLQDVKNVVDNQIERRLFGYSKTRVWNSEFMGWNLISEGSGKDLFMLTYFDDDAILQVNEILNEFRIFDMLEDHFGEDVILHENTV